MRKFDSGPARMMSVKNKNMKRTGFVFITLGSIIMVLLFIQISVSNMLSTGGIQLSDIQQQILDTQRQNALLKEKVLTMSSLTTIAQKAEQDGFVADKTQAIVVSDTQPPLALNQ